MAKQKKQAKHKKILWISLLSLLGLSIVSSAIAIPVALASKYIEQPFVSQEVPISKPPEEEINNDFFINDEMFNIGKFDHNIIKEYTRKANNKSYRGEMYEKYNKNYDFQYPSQKFNYKTKVNNKQQGYFKNKTGSGEIDGFAIMLEERVIDDNGKRVQFADPHNNDKVGDTKFNNRYWIQSEIKNGTFKKHPSAYDLFLNDYSTIPAQTREYTISGDIRGVQNLGFFAPAGEVITIILDDNTFQMMKDWNDRGALSFTINQTFWDNRQASDEGGKVSNRYPYMETDFYFDLQDESKTLKIGSPFGGHINLNINRVWSKSTDFLNDSIQDIKFTIDGGIPTLWYQDGKTTESDWNWQISQAKENKLAPFFAGSAAYFSMGIPFTAYNEVGHAKLDDLIYPKTIFKKWNDFLYLSNYYAGRENDLVKLNMEFNDDIWGGAAAWGGGNAFYCPTNWGSMAFLVNPPQKTFNPYNSWGVFHEINHNFQQNEAFFSKNTHGETNFVTLANLSVLSDAGRYRNEVNIGGTNSNHVDWGWSRLNNPYNIIKDLDRKRTAQPDNKGDKTEEYEIYGLLLYLFGSERYFDYVRKDMKEHQANNTTWNGLDEIKRISNYLGLNMWPAFEHYGQWWRDKWPESTTHATTAELKIIQELEQLPAMDFVFNQYAVGGYLYDQVNSQYIYTGDTIAAMDIPAFREKELRFNEMIVSTNENFRWKDLTIIPTANTIGTFEDTNNANVKIYKPDITKPHQVDEFDVEITPDAWTGKPNNYVPKIRWKVKLRQAIKEPIVNFWSDHDLGWGDETQVKNVIKLDENKIQPNEIQPVPEWTNVFAYENKPKKTKGFKFEFDFVAPADGVYQFKSKSRDTLIGKINGIDYANNYGWKDTYDNGIWKPISLKKGEIKKVDIYLAAVFSDNQTLDVIVEKDGEKINLFDHILAPDAAKILKKPAQEILDDKTLDYQERSIDRDIFTTTMGNNFNFSNYVEKSIPFNQYNFRDDPCHPQYSGKKLDEIFSQPNSVWEVWQGSATPPYHYEKSLTVNFKQPTYVSSVIIGGRRNNWWEGRPTSIKIIGSRSNREFVMYDGEFGKQFGDRGRDKTITNLTNPAEVDTIRFEMVNTKLNCFSLEQIRFNSVSFVPNRPQYAFNNPRIKFEGEWKIHENNQNIQSALNGVYVTSNKKGSKIKFTFKKSKGLVIVGKTILKSSFDVYINGKYVNKNVDTDEIESSNQVLFQYRSDKEEDLEVEIIVNTISPIFSYFFGFGKNAHLG